MTVMIRDSSLSGAAQNESATDCMRDLDNDGYGDENVSGTIVPGTDCDDLLVQIYPLDSDGDGYTICDDDCNDNDIFTFPGAAQK